MMKWNLFTVFALLIASASLSETRIIRRELPEDINLNDCQTRMYIVCIYPHLFEYGGDMATEESRMALVGNRQRLGELADDFQLVRTCAEDLQAKPVCNGTSAEESGLAEIQLYAGFSSSSERVDAVHGTYGSVCYTNDSLRDEFGAESMECLQDFVVTATGGPGNPGLCSGIQSLRTCSVNAGASICGDGVGVFFQSVWAYLSQDVAGASQLFGIIPDDNLAALVQNCNQQVQVARRYTRRGLGGLLGM